MPIVRCLHHDKAGVPSLNLTFDGRVYHSSTIWELDPETVPVVLARLEQDLATGPEVFRRRWEPATLSWYFYNLAPRDRSVVSRSRLVRPGDRGRSPWASRFRSLAVKLEPLAKRDALSADTRVWGAVACLYYAAGDPQKATAAAELAMGRPEPHYWRREMLIELYTRTGQREKLISLLERLLAKDAWNASLGERLATLYDQKGSHDRAEAVRRSADPGSQLPGKPAPDFTLTDLEGKEARLSDLRGKVVLLDFWSSW